MAKAAGGKKGPKAHAGHGATKSATKKADRKRGSRKSNSGKIAFENVTVTLDRGTGRITMVEETSQETMGAVFRKWIKGRKPSTIEDNTLYSGAMVSISRVEPRGGGHDAVTIDSPCP